MSDLLLLGVGRPASTVAAFPSVALLDDFNRADEGPPPSGSYATPTGYNGMQVSSNQLAPSAATDSAALWSTSYGPRMEAAIALPTLMAEAEQVRLMVRNQSATELADCYWAEFERGGGDTKVRLYKYVSAVATLLVEESLPTLLAAGDQVGVRADGTALTAFINGTQVAAATDGDVSAAGYLMLNVPAGNTVRLDNLYGGTMA